MFRNLLREPLTHFTIIACLLYALMSWVDPELSSADENQIVVDDQVLNTYLQSRDQIFDEALHQNRLNRMSNEQRASLVRQFAEQEVLYREAKKLGLGQNDSIFRRRLIQKMKFVLEGLANSNAPLSEQELQGYFEQNRADYIVPANISFTHLFFKTDESNQNSSLTRASQAKESLQSNSSANNIDSDYFPYHKIYVEKTQAQVSRHFGSAFAQALFELGSNEQWQGPLKSAYGHHLVKVSELNTERESQFDEVRARVSADAERAAFIQTQQQQIDALVEQYQVIDAK